MNRCQLPGPGVYGDIPRTKFSVDDGWIDREDGGASVSSDKTKGSHPRTFNDTDGHRRFPKLGEGVEGKSTVVDRKTLVVITTGMSVTVFGQRFRVFVPVSDCPLSLRRLLLFTF